MDAVLQAFQPLSIVAALAGVCLGIIFGAIPGLSATLGIALLLPVTFLMPADHGLIMLAGVYAGGIYGGSISAILLNVPGTVAAVMTSIEGHPMALRGEASTALGLSAVSSGIGGLFSAIALLFLAPLLASWALAFGPAEYVFLILFSLVIVTMMLPTPMLGNAAGCCIGLCLAVLGFDPSTGLPRFSYGYYQLSGGMPLLPVLIGFFAIPQVLILARDAAAQRNEPNRKIDPPASRKGETGIIFRHLLVHWATLIRTSIVGIGLGILPAIGPSATPVTAHALEKRFAKDPERYGNGSITGLIAAETSNNANVGGSLIPLLALGIPGSGAAAVFIGALTIHGINPGPLMFRNHADTMTTFFVGFFIVNIMLVVLGLYGIRYFSLVLRFPPSIIASFIITFAMFGSYASGNGIFYIWALVIAALLALLLKAVSIPILAVLMGFILGGILEVQVVTMLTSFVNPLTILGRPVAMIFAAATIAVAFVIGVQRYKATPNSGPKMQPEARKEA